ncbi:MAG: hypothetical protein CVV53_08120 [Spirochaetae bacterium HGW-Spirochaetae-9]|nr:MAG: hypothetical protein CVV53_08120 [Spirochaetae bacterium HGW-Spirochaetae-9]
MIGFFVKKAFFDGWDNLFALAAFNIVHLALFVLFIVLPLSLGIGNALSMVFIILGFMAIAQWQSITAFAMNGISDYHSPGFRATFENFSSSWKPGLVVGAINVALWFSLTVGIPFYLSQKGFLGLFLASLLFWTCLVALLASQYYLPLEARRGGGFSKNVRVAMILVLDNPGFTLFLFAHNAASLALSALTAFMAPGLAGVALASADAAKLRLMKYDWLEHNPGVDKKHLPWTDILGEEKEMVGERTLKGMIFPWKEGK